MLGVSEAKIAQPG